MYLGIAEQVFLINFLYLLFFIAACFLIINWHDRRISCKLEKLDQTVSLLQDLHKESELVRLIADRNIPQVKGLE